MKKLAKLFALLASVTVLTAEGLESALARFKAQHPSLDF